MVSIFTRRTVPMEVLRGSSAWSTPAHGRGLAVVLDVVYKHLAGRELPRSLRTIFHRSLRYAVGAGSKFDGPDSHHVRRFVCDNALVEVIVAQPHRWSHSDAFSR